MKATAQPAQDTLGKANCTVEPWECEPGQKVLLFLPELENKLLMHWQGQFEVVRKVEPVNDQIHVANQRIKLFHVHLLKACLSKEEAAAYWIWPAEQEESEREDEHDPLSPTQIWQVYSWMYLATIWGEA